MRQNIRGIEGYRKAQRSAEDAGARLFAKVGPCTSIGPVYMPKAKPYEFRLAVTDPSSVQQLRVLRNVGRAIGMDTYGVLIPESLENNLRLTNLLTKEQRELSVTDFQNFVMQQISQGLSPHKHWNVATFSDDTTANITPLDAETNKLLEQRADWLDWIMRSVPSDNLVKLDIDVVTYDFKHQPTLLAEIKHDSAAPYFDITKKLGWRLHVPAGLITYDEKWNEQGKRDGFTYHTRGFDTTEHRNLTLEQAAEFIGELI
jgi:hypothetical protein